MALSILYTYCVTIINILYNYYITTIAYTVLWVVFPFFGF